MILVQIMTSYFKQFKRELKKFCWWNNPKKDQHEWNGETSHDKKSDFNQHKCLFQFQPRITCLNFSMFNLRFHQDKLRVRLTSTNHTLWVLARAINKWWVQSQESKRIMSISWLPLETRSNMDLHQLCMVTKKLI